ncbi:MAG: nucleotidyltransferase family protein [Candidatus Bathyarchaeota archaeon]|nr:nucleotidyltransferase family protein [Candidatus Bathyarchaeota archaeon]
MQDVATIKRILSLHKAELKRKFKVKTIGVFGSYVRGEQKGTSDVDVLVEFSEPVGLFEFMKLENYLSDLLSVKVDLVSKKGLKLHIGEHILEEVIMI